MIENYISELDFLYGTFIWYIYISATEEKN